MMDTGTIGWLDLTVEDADGLRDFYASVCGWSYEGVDMGGYADYAMSDANGRTVTGICHARGVNAQVPNVWLPYFVVTDLEGALERAVASGATLLDTRHNNGTPMFAILKDPSGTPFALSLPSAGQDESA